jgi:hypothetical protein
MIPNNEIKEALISKGRAIAGLTAPLPTGTLPDGLQGVREHSWKGTDYNYPNVRLELETQVPTTNDSNCAVGLANWSWYVFSEMHSSQEADRIAGIILANFRGISFQINNVHFSRIVILENIPAVSQDERTWRAQVRCQSLVYP